MAAMPLAIDLFCGLGGWTDGLIAEGYYVVGFDIERHHYGDAKYPAQLVLQDVLTIHGSQFKDAALIVASPPCQEYSYMAMPWGRAKAIAAEYRSGARDVKNLTALFDACFRIQQEASEAAGHHIPMVVENVRGACPWVGRSRWNFGSFHLWGDVPALMPMVKKAIKVPKFRFDGSGKSFQTASVERTKNDGGSWFNIGGPGQKETNRNPVYEHIKVQSYEGNRTAKGKGARFTSRDCGEEVKQGGDWFNKESGNSISRTTSSKSKARKAASAAIAKIPFTLSQYIAQVYKP